MVNGRSLRIWTSVPLLAAALAWPGSTVPANPAPLTPAKSKTITVPEAKAAPADAPASEQGNPQATQPAPAKPLLAEAFIAQSLLRIYLNHPAAITVYNSRGQQIIRMDSQRPLETVPLQGLTTGFVYVVVRAGPVEMSKKLVYTGK